MSSTTLLHLQNTHFINTADETRSYRGSEKPPVEYRNAADGTRSYQKSGKPLAEYRNELDYSDFGDGPRAVRQTRSDRGKPITHRFHPHNSLESADAAISAHDLTTIDKSTPPRRPANLFLVTPARPIYFEASVSMITDNIGFLSATGSFTYPTISDTANQQPPPRHLCFTTSSSSFLPRTNALASWPPTTN